MFDGDYDVILAQVIDKKISPNLSKKSAPINYTIKNLLEDSYPSSKKQVKKSASLSILDVLKMKYPYLQITIPIHAEEWDEKNYIPVVTFLPEEYNDATTTVLSGYDSKGNIVELDVLNEPDKPVIVISQNERIRGIDPDPTGDLVLPETPTNLTGTQTESGIRLSWEMPSNAMAFNTTGYYIYRKDAESTVYSRIGVITGVYNRSYDDNAIEASRSYSYYVMAYNQGVSSHPSNYITVIAPNLPKPVLAFDAIQNSKNEIELRWQNNHDQYIMETQLYKHVIGVTNNYNLLNSFSPNEHDFFDNNVIAGKKVVYKINHITNLGKSNAKYDFIQVPFRDISENSPVFIKKIKFSDWRIERWAAGKPEFYVTVTNVDAGGKTPYTVQDQIVCNFSKREKESQVFTGKKVIEWKPGFWFDMLTFTAIEYDRTSGDLKINASVGYNKKNIDSTGLDARAGVSYEITFRDKGEKCGSEYLNYFDNPEKWLQFPNYGVEILVSESDN
ncbi:DUF3103 family protein [Prolixibacteraceae bacterium JC049]|nr:DUF3103 family protein [Prolixibacteraceae bacterium JC049]